MQERRHKKHCDYLCKVINRSHKSMLIEVRTELVAFVERVDSIWKRGQRSFKAVNGQFPHLDASYIGESNLWKFTDMCTSLHVYDALLNVTCAQWNLSKIKRVTQTQYQ